MEAATKGAHEVIGDCVDTDAQYLTREQQVADEAAADLGVARRQVRLLQYRARGHPVPPTTCQDFHFREALEAQSASEIQNLLTKAQTTLKEAIKKWNQITRVRAMTNELRRLDLEEKTSDERELSREILYRMTNPHGDTAAASLLSQSGGSIPDSVSAALRAAVCRQRVQERRSPRSRDVDPRRDADSQRVDRDSRAMEGCSGAAGTGDGRDNFRGDTPDGGHGVACAGASRGGGRRRRRRRAAQLAALPFDVSPVLAPTSRRCS